jgi:hypothetical protein
MDAEIQPGKRRIDAAVLDAEDRAIEGHPFQECAAT